MIRAMWTSATGMNAQEMMVNTIANNLANVNTTSFKKSRVDFEDLFYATYTGKGSQTPEGGTVPVGIEVGMGVRPVAIQKIFTQGDYLQTDNSLDLSIEGNGFFLVLSDGDEVYTRDGAFKIDSEGYVVNSVVSVCSPRSPFPRIPPPSPCPRQGRSPACPMTGTRWLPGIYPFTSFPIRLACGPWA